MIKFTLSGSIVPKARPRVSRGIAYLPANYRHWKLWAIGQFLVQCREQKLTLPLPSPLAIFINYQGTGRGDSDNIAGAILDALVGGNIIVDDSVTHIPKLTFTFQKSPAKNSTCDITLIPC